jgi:dTDP-4-dehydrorhamnose reductase
VRYYTLAEEVAGAFAFLMQAGRNGRVHVSAPESSTKMEFMREAAAAMGCDQARVGLGEGGVPAARRPVDSHLATDRYFSLGGGAFTGWRAALASFKGAQRL